jgi:PPOX class probable F420-dependent enzyme
MATLDEWSMDLLTGRNFAHVSTIRPDGTPHVTITWVDAADGQVLVNTAAGRVKDRHLRRDPRVSVTVRDEHNPFRWLRVDGIVEEFVTGPVAEEHVDTLSRRYNDGKPWEPEPGQERVMYRIRPIRVFQHDDA